MSAMHPESGVPPSDARNSLPNDVEASQNCDELWYSTSRCQPRFDPAAANAMLAELINLINKGEVVYDCRFLDQVQYAVRYLIQRGLPHSGIAFAGPADYLITLDPPMTRYSDHLTLILVPEQNNSGPVRVNVNGHGLRPVLRNDGQPLQKDDWLLGRPLMISYWIDTFYMVGFVNSQIPCIGRGSIDIWIRTDGDDVNGDGSANTPQKAFRTIQEAWNKVVQRCVATPQYVINLRLGIPGLYDGAILGPFGGTVILWGDQGNAPAYRVFVSRGLNASIYANSIANMRFNGVTFVLDSAPGYGTSNIFSDQSYITVIGCGFEVLANAPNHACINLRGGLGSGAEGLSFTGSGGTISHLIGAAEGGTWIGCGSTRGCNYQVNNFNFAGACIVGLLLGVQSWPSSSFSTSACTGPRYNVSGNSVVTANGLTFPGSTAGVVSSGGQYLP